MTQRPHTESARGPSLHALYERLTERAREVARVAPAEGEALQRDIDAWWRAQQEWQDELSRQLGVYHDINNALVGVRGNAQLLLIGPAGQTPGVKERLEVVIRESERIQQAAAKLGSLRTGLGPTEPTTRAA